MRLAIDNNRPWVHAAAARLDIRFIQTTTEPKTNEERLQRARVFLGRSRPLLGCVGWVGFGFGCRAIESKLIDRQPSPPPPHRAKAQLLRSTGAGGVRRPQQQQRRSVCVPSHHQQIDRPSLTPAASACQHAHNVNQVDLMPEPNKTTTTTQLWTRHPEAAAALAAEARPLPPSRRRPTESTWISGGRQGKATWSGAAGSSRSRAWT